MSLKTGLDRRLSAAAVRTVQICAISLFLPAAAGAEIRHRARAIALWSASSLTDHRWLAAVAATMVVVPELLDPRWRVEIEAEALRRNDC